MAKRNNNTVNGSVNVQNKRPKMSLKTVAEGWQNFPDLIFCDIIMMVGLESLEDLHKCRQVCQSWNVMTSQMPWLKKDTIRKRADSLALQIRKKWVSLFYTPSLLEIVTAASLAHHRLLGSVWRIVLHDVDLASVPAQHLAALASCVTMTLITPQPECKKGYTFFSMKPKDLQKYMNCSKTPTSQSV